MAGYYQEYSGAGNRFKCSLAVFQCRVPNYSAPFPAQIVAPLSGASVVSDINSEIELEWSGADVDNDIVGYEIFLDTVSPPQVLVASPAASVSSIKVNTIMNTVYYWKSDYQRCRRKHFRFWDLFFSRPISTSQFS